MLDFISLGETVYEDHGHPYGKLKYLDLLEVHFLVKMSIGLDFLYYCYTIKLGTEWQDPKHAKNCVFFHLVKHS